jgi:hypothetical protein
MIFVIPKYSPFLKRSNLKAMRIIYFLILTLYFTLPTLAQDVSQPVQSNFIPPPEKIKFSLNAGTSFVYSPNSFAGSSFFVAPKLSYNLTPKFRLNAGIMMVKQNLNLSSSLLPAGENQSQSVVLKNSSNVQGVLFAQGDYLLTERLTLSGWVMKSIDSNNNYKNPSWNNSFQAMSMGINYKLSNTISVGAGVHMIQSNGYNNYFPGTFISPVSNPFSYRSF